MNVERALEIKKLLRQFTIGKEYEVPREPAIILAHEDGSGPYEFSIPPFRLDKLEEALILELILLKLEKENLVEYYVDDDGEEQKGNHFHYRFRNMEDKAKEIALQTIAISLSLPLLRNFTNDEPRFRNSFYKWNEELVTLAFLVALRDGFIQDWKGRQYAVVTFNRNRKKTLTLEIRASETLLLYDLYALLTATAFQEKYYPKVAFNKALWILEVFSSNYEPFETQNNASVTFYRCDDIYEVLDFLESELCLDIELREDDEFISMQFTTKQIKELLERFKDYYKIKVLRRYFDDALEVKSVDAYYRLVKRIVNKINKKASVPLSFYNMLKDVVSFSELKPIADFIATIL